MRALKIWGMTMVVVIAVLGLYIYQNNREYQIILLNTNDSHGSILPVWGEWLSGLLLSGW